MFKKLFGGSTGPAKKQAQPTIDPAETMNKLSDQIEIVEKRAKKIDEDMKKYTVEALQKKKAGDQRGKDTFEFR